MNFNYVRKHTKIFLIYVVYYSFHTVCMKIVIEIFPFKLATIYRHSHMQVSKMNVKKTDWIYVKTLTYWV